MSLQKLLKIVNVCNRRQILLPNSIAFAYRYQHLKFCPKIHSKFLPSANFATSTVHQEDKCVPGDDKSEDPSGSIVNFTVFVEQLNIEKEITAQIGMTVLEAVLKVDKNLINHCDGQVSCQCCHCLVEEDHMHYFTGPNEREEDLLDSFDEVQPNSRLACQMKIIKKFEHTRIEII